MKKTATTFNEELIGYFYGGFVILGITVGVGTGYIWGNRGSDLIIFPLIGLFIGIGLSLLTQGFIAWSGNKKK